MGHTPTPQLVVDRSLHGLPYVQIKGGHNDGKTLCQLSEEDAKHIEKQLRACNAHDEMTKALKECVEALQCDLGLDERYKIEAIKEDALERAEALLKKLEASHA